MKLSGLLVVSAAFALSACAAPSIYASGRSSADVPSRIDVINFDGADGLREWPKTTNTMPATIIAPSENTQAVTAIAKNAAVNQFENFGIHVEDDNSRRPDLRVHLYVSYVPEYGLFVHRSIFVGAYILAPDGSPIFRETIFEQSAAGLLTSLLESRESMTTRVTRKLIQNTMTELNKGTASPAQTAPAS